MTGFSGIEPIDADQGFADNTRGNYFKRWTTVGLPDQGRNSAHDDDQQPVGSGADETVMEGTPLKVPMEAEDIPRPKIREGREASPKATALRKVALRIRKISPVYARRLMAAADELEYDDLSTARLELSGDEANPIDDSQDNNGHGELKFWGTAPARKTSLPRESSRRSAEDSLPFRPTEVAYQTKNGQWKRKVFTKEVQFDRFIEKCNEDGIRVETRPVEGYQASRKRACSIGQTEGGDYILQDEGGFKIEGPFKSKTEAQEAQESYMKEMEEEQEKSANLEYASRGASRRRPSRRRATSDSDASGGHNWNHNDWKAALDLVPKALEGKYDRGAVGKILDAEYKRTSDLLRGNSTSPTQAADPHVRHGDMMASRGRKAGPPGKGNIPPTPGSQRSRERDDKNLGTRTHFLGGSKEVRKLTTPEAVVRYSKGTAWGLSPEVAERYLQEGPFYLLLEDGRRVGMYYPARDVMQDERDRPIPPEQAEEWKSLIDGSSRGASRKRARAEGDAPLHPEPTVGDQDGPGADGASAFVDRAKAPLQETMTADDVDRPRLRENPEASRSLWSAFKEALKRQGSIEGDWNDGRYQVASRDYGNTLEITASVRDREGIETPVGNVTLSVINDSPDGRYASIEMNDDLIEKQVRDFTLRRKQAGRLASWIVAEAVDVSKGALEHITC